MRFLPCAEPLESRRLLSTLTVNTLTDTNAMDSTTSALDAAGHVSLRSALENFDDQLRGNSQPTVIQFDVGAGNPTIKVGSTGLGPLPSVLANINGQPVVINGSSGGATRVVLDGSMAGQAASGLTLIGAKTIVEGLVIDNFSSNGIVITGEDPHPGDGDHLIRSNYIGTDATGTMAAPNGGAGILIRDGTPDNSIGGPNPGDGNVISGNKGDGIRIEPLAAGMTLPAGTAGNIIQGNFIGTNATGTAAVGNGGNGVSVMGDSPGGAANTPPSIVGAAGNVISGNAGDGVFIHGLFALTGSKVQANFIGTDAAGNVAIPNSGNGVHITDSPNNTVGGTGSEGNIISGNDGSGVLISLAASAGNHVQGNTIGANSAGDASVANKLDGVQISLGAPSNEVGGSMAGQGNLISGNTRAGVSIDGSNANRVQNNLIGPNRAETSALPNGTDGVSIVDGGQQTTVVANRIEGNTGNGVLLSGAGTNQNSILSNFIGSARAHNHGDGIQIAASAMTNTVSLNSVGNNDGDGIAIPATDDNTITANQVLGNTGAGISIQGGSTNSIGGALAAAQNVISGNFGPGVSITGGANNVVENNFIGVDATGNVASPNGTAQAPQPGVLISDATNTTVENNLISANTGAGVRVIGDNAAGNVIRMNRIGISADGSTSLLNSALGIDLGPAGVTQNTPGGPHTGPNHLQNFPVLTSVSENASGTTVMGTLNSAPSASFTIDLYSNLVFDPSGFGQGQTYLGSVIVNTDSSGNTAFTFNTATKVASGRFITATATSSSNDTSEFSQFIQLQGGGAQDTINGTNGNDAITLKKDADGTDIDWTLNGGPVNFVPINDPKGLTINGNGGTDTITLDNSKGDPTPDLLVLNQTGAGSKFILIGLSQPTAGHKIDIQNSTVQINYTGTSILPAVRPALAGGSIFSSTLASNPRFAIADNDSADPLNSGQAANTVLLRPAIIGNATLSGKVGFNDFVQLARNYNKTNADWAMGDFNYDGKVGFDDLVALARNYNQSGPAATAAALTPAATAEMELPLRRSARAVARRR